jgi:hypothetical protein
MVARFHAGDTPQQREHVLERNERHLAYVAEHGRGAPRRRHARALRWVVAELADVRAQLETITYYVPPQIRAAFMCIHGGEGAWDDPDAPYWGGLQMDLEFQETYGPELLAAKGTADHWTAAEQIHVAYRAYRSGRGFHPWPNTAHRCGLI